MSQSTPLIQPTANDPFLLSNDSGRVSYYGKRVSLVLSAEALYVFEFTSKQALRDLNLQSLIGAKSRKGKKTDSHCYLDLFYYDFPKSSCCSSKSRLRTREVISFKFATSDAECEEWASNILTTMNNKTFDKTEQGLTTRRNNSRRILIFVNPVSGTRIAVRTYETIVKPMLIEAGAGMGIVV